MKCVALFSGGLDSILAIKLVKEQGLEVIALNIRNGFSSKDNTEYLKDITNKLGVELVILDNVSNFLENILYKPKFGYGKNFNPCVDCHANFITIAWEYAKSIDAKFIITGEVLNQRGMSQTGNQLKKVNQLCDIGDYIVRPLSAKLLKKSIPEIEGWVDREKFLNICGKKRKKQLELIKETGIENFESPAGGCLLTCENFSNRLTEFSYKSKINSEELIVLKNSRLFIIDDFRLMITKNKENNNIVKDVELKNFIKLLPDFDGPIGFLDNDATDEIKLIAAKICLRYINKKTINKVFIQNEIIQTEKFTNDECLKYLKS